MRTLTVLQGTPLAERFHARNFQLVSPLTRLREVKLFVENLDLENCFLASDHLSNYLWAGNAIIYRGISGTLPQEKELMLKAVQEAISAVKTSPMEVKDSNQIYNEGMIPTL